MARQSLQVVPSLALGKLQFSPRSRFNESYSHIGLCWNHIAFLNMQDTISLFTSLMSFSVSCCMTSPPIRFMLIFVILQVDFVPNLDNSQKEPSLLPARISSLLLNDSSGIAVWVCIHFIQVLLSQIFIYAKMGFLQLFKLFQVGMATNIPPHNLGELVDALSVIIQNPEATVSNLYHISLWVQYYVRLFVCMYVEKALSCYFSCDNY